MRTNAGARLMGDHEVEPDVLAIPYLLSTIIDELIEAEQRRTGEPANTVRARFRQEQIDAIAAWAAEKQGGAHASG